MDIDGCAVDPIIQPDVKYESSLRKAYVETHGYKFSDTSVLNYLCVLELCKKATGECAGLTPPSCGRGKRSVETIVVKVTYAFSSKENRLAEDSRGKYENTGSSFEVLVLFIFLNTLLSK